MKKQEEDHGFVPDRELRIGARDLLEATLAGWNKADSEQRQQIFY